jgi:hypothetical protein
MNWIVLHSCKQSKQHATAKYESHLGLPLDVSVIQLHVFTSLYIDFPIFILSLFKELDIYQRINSYSITQL